MRLGRWPRYGAFRNTASVKGSLKIDPFRHLRVDHPWCRGAGALPKGDAWSGRGGLPGRPSEVQWVGVYFAATATALPSPVRAGIRIVLIKPMIRDWPGIAPASPCVPVVVGAV